MITSPLKPAFFSGVWEARVTFPVRGEFFTCLDTKAGTLWINGRYNPLTRDGDVMTGTAPVEGYPYTVTCRRDGFGWVVEFGD